MAEYLTLCGRQGIILNPEKFTFGKDEVDWADMRITKDKVEPMAEHVDCGGHRHVPQAGEPD